MEIRHTIKKSVQFGNLQFPIRADYVDHFIENGAVATAEELFANEKYVSIIHRHWHGEGRNGCIFALLAARKAEEIGWQDYVVTQNIGDIESQTTINSIAERIQQAIHDPKCEILSLLFSKIITDKDLIQLIIHLSSIENITLVDEEEYGDFVTVGLRLPINKKNVLSWIMAFGPFDYFPKTRQSPITELAIRVKPKSEKQFHRLSKDTDAAHLADLPVNYRLEMMEKTWEKTQERTELILGEKPNHFSAAKTTFTLPKEIWNEQKHYRAGIRYKP